jgi:hypothetical protein
MAELQRIEVGGKPGTAAYLDENMALCDPDEAVWCKVVFDDGSRTFYRVGPAQQTGTPQAL